MNSNHLDQLKQEYMSTPIPRELDFVVRKALQKSRHKSPFDKIRIAAASIAAALALVTVGVNSSPVFAQALAEVPVVGSIVQVLTFRQFTVREDNFEADIKVPKIQGLENKDLESSLNEKYLAENKKLYEEFKAAMEEGKEKGGGHLGVGSGYEVVTDNDAIFTVKRYEFTVAGSSDTKIKYDTIDKKREILITLPSLFKDDSYVEVISDNIINQMKEQMASDENKVYWLDGYVEEFQQPFERISKDQGFYINADGKLVISFDKYEVAPGYMGVVEFVIPTEAISDILVGNEYIK
ncbi:MAG: DUF3298 and DUF4163 domain-containing protein [Firmicutes bacterium]|nr:DUF3298 and DUF4163 domain-containing protein [Bacillota bacterium]